MGSKLHILGVALILGIPSVSHAGRPLVTDDSGTLGQQGIQIETGVEVSFWKDKEEGIEIKEQGIEASATFTYGLIDTLDLVAGVPYVWSKVKGNGVTIFDENGISDISFEAKWRFFETDGLGLALKPGISLPTGDYKDGFGPGKVTYGLTLIASKEFDAFGIHFNGGYLRNENKVEERKDLFAFSLAATYEVIDGLAVVADVGFERNADPETDTLPAFVLGGVNYAVTDFLMLDAGAKFGLTKQEVDQAFIGGLTFNF